MANGETASWWVWDADDNSVVGRFKTVEAGYPPTAIYAIGMERVAYALGVQIDLPIPAVELGTVDGKQGCVMYRAGGENCIPYGWGLRQSGMTANILNAAVWPLAVLFDLWIANIDRSDSNIVVDPAPPYRRPVQAAQCVSWLVDHEKSGLWWPTKIEEAAALDPEALSEQAVNEGAMTDWGNGFLIGMMPTAYRQSLERLTEAEREPHLEIVRGISDDQIHMAVSELPVEFMSARAKELTIAFLAARRDRIYTLTGDAFPIPR